jgi:hypothetical protein
MSREVGRTCPCFWLHYRRQALGADPHHCIPPCRGLGEVSMSIVTCLPLPPTRPPEWTVMSNCAMSCVELVCRRGCSTLCMGTARGLETRSCDTRMCTQCPLPAEPALGLSLPRQQPPLLKRCLHLRLSRIANDYGWSFCLFYDWLQLLLTLLGTDISGAGWQEPCYRHERRRHR